MDQFITLVSSKTAPFGSLALPIAPVQPISAFVSGLVSSPIHPALPVARLGALHAARVALIWAGLTKSKQVGRAKRVGLMGDLFGYLVMCWGGGTVVPMLLGQPPSWLLSSTPWLTYLPIYLLLVPTTLAEYIHTTCPPILFNLVGALCDGITRGTTVCTIPAALAAAGVPPTVWTTAVLGGIACTSGGIMVQLLGLAEEDWRLGMPSVLRGGILNTLDFWGGMLAALLYAASLRLTPELSTISSLVTFSLPEDLLLKTGPASTSVPADIARGLVVLFLAALFSARVMTLAVLSPRPILGKAKKLDDVEKEIAEAVLHEKVAPSGQVGAAPTTRARSRASTPKKSPKVKSS